MRYFRNAAERSLRRLRTDRIELYYAHKDDAATPLEETLRAFDALDAIARERSRHSVALDGRFMIATGLPTWIARDSDPS